MGDWPIGDISKITTAYSNPATSLSFTIDCAQDNTKGAWAEVISATPFDVSGIILSFVRPYATGEMDCLIDIGTGANPNEVAIISDLLYTHSTAATPAYSYFVPISIPKGTRISARGQCSDTAYNRNVMASILLISGTFQSQQPCMIVDTYGATAADSGGTSVDPGGSANTKGSYSQLSASIARATKGIAIGIGNQGNTGRTTAMALLDIAVGGAGSENVVISDLFVHLSALEGTPPFTYPFIPISIPAGSRIAARAQCSITDATDRLFDVVLYCFG